MGISSAKSGAAPHDRHLRGEPAGIESAHAAAGGNGIESGAQRRAESVVHDARQVHIRKRPVVSQGEGGAREHDAGRIERVGRQQPRLSVGPALDQRGLGRDVLRDPGEQVLGARREWIGGRRRLEDEQDGRRAREHGVRVVQTLAVRQPHDRGGAVAEYELRGQGIRLERGSLRVRDCRKRARDDGGQASDQGRNQA
jgi:hypothetical protein